MSGPGLGPLARLRLAPTQDGSDEPVPTEIPRLVDHVGAGHAEALGDPGRRAAPPDGGEELVVRHAALSNRPRSGRDWDGDPLLTPLPQDLADELALDAQAPGDLERPQALAAESEDPLMIDSPARPMRRQESERLQPPARLID